MLFLEIKKVSHSNVIHDNISGLKGKLNIDSFELIFESADDNKESFLNGRSEKKTDRLFFFILLYFVSDFSFLFWHIVEKLFEKFSVYLKGSIRNENLSLENWLDIQPSLSKHSNCLIETLSYHVDQV